METGILLEQSPWEAQADAEECADHELGHASQG